MRALEPSPLAYLPLPALVAALRSMTPAAVDLGPAPTVCVHTHPAVAAPVFGVLAGIARGAVGDVDAGGDGLGALAAHPATHRNSTVEPLDMRPVYPQAHATMATASISTIMSGSTSPDTSTIAVAGRMAPNTSPCTRATGSH